MLMTKFIISINITIFDKFYYFSEIFLYWSKIYNKSLWCIVDIILFKFVGLHIACCFFFALKLRQVIFDPIVWKKTIYRTEKSKHSSVNRIQRNCIVSKNWIQYTQSVCPTQIIFIESNVQHCMILLKNRET